MSDDESTEPASWPGAFKHLVSEVANVIITGLFLGLVGLIVWLCLGHPGVR